MASDSFSGINQFHVFDVSAFLKGKTLAVKACAPLQEYKDGQPTGKVIGTKVTIGILDDHTEYRAYSDGSVPDNSFKCFDVKLIGKMGFSLPKRSRVNLVNPTGTIYAAQGSTRRDRISISAEDIQVLQAKKPVGA